MAGGAPEAAALRERYLTAIADWDAAGAGALIERAVDEGMSPEAAYLAVLGPALEEVGRRWERGELSVAEEHFATAVTQSVVARIAPRLRTAPAGIQGDGAVARRAVVACTPEELHAVGTRFVADFLEGDGWEVIACGASTPVESLVELVAATRPQIVALSTTLAANVPRAAEVFRMLRELEEPPLLVAGGAAYAGDEARALAVGADVFATDPARLCALLRERLAPAGRP